MYNVYYVEQIGAIPLHLGEFVKQYRTEHHISQRQFARLCGISNGYLSMLEQNKHYGTGDEIIPSLATLKAIAGGMNMSLTDLIRSIDDMPVKLSYELDEQDDANEDLDEIRESLRRSPEMRTLFSITKNATAKELRQTIAILQSLKGLSDDE